MHVVIDSRFDPEQAGSIKQCLIGLAYGLRDCDSSGNKFTFLTLPGKTAWLQEYAGGPVGVVETVEPAPSATEKAKRLAGPLRPALGKLARLARLGKPGTLPSDLPKLDTVSCPVEFDLWHTTSPYLAVQSARPVVLTIHDIQHKHWPQYFTEAELSWRDRSYSTAIQSATSVTTVSDFCSEDIQNHYQVPPEKITAVRWGSPVACYSSKGPDPDKTFLESRGIRKPFAFFPSETYGHKNHLGLLEGVARLRGRIGECFQVVCSGHQRHVWTTIQDRLGALGLERTVVFTGYVTDAGMRTLFNEASALIFPSLFEGAGLGLIEALDCKLPIACSDIPPFREYAGDAALFFNPLDLEEMANALNQVLFNNDARQKLGGAASQRREQFSWTSVGREYLSVYQNTLALHRARPAAHASV